MSIVIVTQKITSIASHDFCHMRIAFANRFDPDQDGQNVSPDLDPNHLTFFPKNRRYMKDYPACIATRSQVIF